MAGLALRLWLLKDLFLVNGDSLVYGGLAVTLLHGRYGLDQAGGAIAPTLIRLPGYPLFLALCFGIFGKENYFAAVLVQIALELLGCLLLADFAARIAPPRLKSGARIATLWLAALCPFTASYSVLPLAEAPTLFVVALALWAMARFLDLPIGQVRFGLPSPSPLPHSCVPTESWWPQRWRRRSCWVCCEAMRLPQSRSKASQEWR